MLAWRAAFDSPQTGSFTSLSDEIPRHSQKPLQARPSEGHRAHKLWHELTQTSAAIETVGGLGQVETSEFSLESDQDTTLRMSPTRALRRCASKVNDPALTGC